MEPYKRLNKLGFHVERFVRLEHFSESVVCQRGSTVERRIPLMEFYPTARSRSISERYFALALEGLFQCSSPVGFDPVPWRPAARDGSK